MCLGMPGRVIAWVDGTDHVARVEVQGVERQVNMALVQDEGLEVGDWVMVQLGLAVDVVDEADALRVSRELDALDRELEQQLDAYVRRGEG